MELIQEALLFPHAWVRAAACRVLSLYLSRRDVMYNRLMTSADSVESQTEVLLRPNAWYQLARRLCIVINQPSLADALLRAATTCLVFAVRALHYNPELSILDTSDPRLSLEERSQLNQEAVEDDADDGAAVYAEDQPDSDVDSLSGDNDFESDAPTDSVAVDKNDDEDTSLGNDRDADRIEEGARITTNGANWAMQRLRAIGSDTRGARRLYAVKVSHFVLYYDPCVVIYIESIP